MILHALGMLAVDLFKSRSRLEAENLFLRHQLNIALRRAPPRLRLRGSDRALLILITKLWPVSTWVPKLRPKNAGLFNTIRLNFLSAKSL